ncbi:MAG: 2-oxoacid:acceptor oxidoreductase subunit alpha [Desulfobacteraceae bacterium]|nr:2-oxoacid:acceptor oxidoreductase subunit alpha [Desulfobacteraceae bacterium]
MGIDVTVKIGGQAGQGIQTVGELLAAACHESGLYLHGINDFESRIRGGHSFMQLRISDSPVQAPDHRVHLLVALNERTLDTHRSELAAGGLVLLDSESERSDTSVLCVPVTKLARDAGGAIMANTVAAGACLALLGAPAESIKAVLKAQFLDKSESVLENNLKAAKSGAKAVEGIQFDRAFKWPESRPAGKLLTGARMLALGALAADCRFAGFYPMSPATGIMANLAEFEDRLPLVVEQAEDEIAAVNMAIGASFAGVRAMTATSGGGFALMTEGLGLAGITETPLVVINSQRPGPATGLPTRTAQGDLRFVLHAAQDEFPRFVFAPDSLDSAFEIMIRSFDLADRYQVPVIVLTDQYFNDSIAITQKPLEAPSAIERFVVDDADMDDSGEYRRFAVTESGVSPRALPCEGRALVMVSGNEHQEDGHISEKVSDRIGQMNKRHRKLSGMEKQIRPPRADNPDSSVLLAGWGSTAGAIRESAELLRAEGIDAGAVCFTDIWPFPAKETAALLDKCSRFYMVEQNFSAQLGWLIAERTGRKFHQAIVKYDGRPFFPDEIARRVKAFEEGANG